MKSVVKHKSKSIVNFDPGAVINNMIKNSVSLESIIISRSPSINRLIRSYGEDRVKKIVTLATSKAMELANVPALNMTGLEVLVSELIGKYGRLKIEDIVQIMKNGVLGRYGQSYGRIGLDNILGSSGWVEQYNNERAEKEEQLIQERIGEDKSKRAKVGPDDITYEEYLKKVKTARVAPENIGSTTNPQKKRSYKYNNIRAYCEANDINYQEYIEGKIKNWESEYFERTKHDNNLISKNIFLAMKEQAELIFINKGL